MSQISHENLSKSSPSCWPPEPFEAAALRPRWQRIGSFRSHGGTPIAGWYGKSQKNGT